MQRITVEPDSPPAPRTIRRIAPSTGSNTPGPTATRPGCAASARRSHSSRLCAKPSASASLTPRGTVSVTSPSSPETRSDNRRARALRRRVTATGGLPGMRCWPI